MQNEHEQHEHKHEHEHERTQHDLPTCTCVYCAAAGDVVQEILISIRMTSLLMM